MSDTPRKIPLTVDDYNKKLAWWFRKGSVEYPPVYVWNLLPKLTDDILESTMREGWERSYDHKTWEPCYKYEPEEEAE